MAYMACNDEDERNSEETVVEWVVVVSVGINRTNQRKTISNESRVLSLSLLATLSFTLTVMSTSISKGKSQPSQAKAQLSKAGMLHKHLSNRSIDRSTPGRAATVV